MKALTTSLAIAASIAFTGQTLAASQGQDTYIQGFKTYAEDLKKYGGETGMSSAVKTYAEDVKKEQLKAGYIGPKLNIPAAVKVTDNVYTVVGSLIWHNPSNYGLNNNLTFIEFADGVMVFNAGPNPAVAAAFHRIIKQYTKKPVKWLVVENNQGHAHLGASYWYDQGVRNIYSHDVAFRDLKNDFNYTKRTWGSIVGHEITDSSRNISEHYTTFQNEMSIDVGGGETVELLNFGPGHTPGSTLAYIPSKNLVLTGDLAYNKRMISIFSYTDSFAWVDSFMRFYSAMPKDVLVIPGHGGPTDLEKVKEDTHDYLTFLHEAVKQHIAAGKGEAELEDIDQSAYKDRPVYAQTYRTNAVRIYKALTRDSFEANE